MVDVNLSIGILSSAAALYGFVIAYYVFARLLLEQEAWRAEYGLRTWMTVTEDRYREVSRNLLQRRILITLLLLGSTIFSLLSLAYTLTSMITGDGVSLAIGAVYLLALVAVVIVFFSGVSMMGLLESLRAWRRTFGGKREVAAKKPNE